jgi:uncharacterized membrane protein
MGWGKRAAGSALLGIGVSLITFFGLGYVPTIYSTIQQLSGAGAMFFLVFGYGILKDTEEEVAK